MAGQNDGFDRRRFLQLSAGAVLLPAVAKHAIAAPTPQSAPETAVKALYDSLSEKQKREVCFAFDFVDPKRGLLRTRVSNNWKITNPTITGGDFYTKAQQTIVHDIFRGLVSPEWYERFLKQSKDDSGGKPWGSTQAIAIFGEPGSKEFEFVLTGRHQTLRADGNTQKNVAFGGPIFYGHAPTDSEDADHKGNVFWPQAVAANKVYAMLDEKQRKAALVETTPRESAVSFAGEKVKSRPGLAVSELSGDQKAELEKVLLTLVEPFRTDDRDEAKATLKTQGGLNACRLSYFADSDIGDDGVYDNWRLEGPSFVWHYRGDPHVHVWVNIADVASVTTNAAG